MAKNNKRNDDINVINPSDLDRKQIEDLNIQTLQQQKEIDDEIDQFKKKIRGKLWLWWFLPIFGWIIYSWAISSRYNRPEINKVLIALKKQSAEKQLQLMLNQKRVEQLDNEE